MMCEHEFRDTIEYIKKQRVDLNLNDKHVEKFIYFLNMILEHDSSLCLMCNEYTRKYLKDD